MLRDITMMRQEIHHLESGIQRYLGEDLSCLKYEDLIRLEEELDKSVAKVRNRQVNNFSFF